MAEQTTGRKGLEAGNVAARNPAGRKAFAGAKPESVDEKVDRLIRWLNSPIEKLPFLAVTELRGMGKEGMPAMIEALGNSDDKIRLCAVTILVEKGDKATLRYLTKSLTDPSPAVCAVAEMAICAVIRRHLGEFKPESVREMAKKIGGAYGRELDRLLEGTE